MTMAYATRRLTVLDRVLKRAAQRLAAILLWLALLCFIASTAELPRKGAVTRDDLPYACALIKYYRHIVYKGYTEKQMRQVGKEKGVKLSRRQEQAIAACLDGKFDK